MLSRRYAAAFLVLVTAIVAVAYVLPIRFVFAEGTAADKMCPAEEKDKKEYNPSKPWNKPFTEVRNGEKKTIQNLFGKPCWDETNKEKTIGHCLRKDRCLADKTAENKDPATCKQTGQCPEGQTTAPKEAGGQPPSPPSPGGGGGGGAGGGEAKPQPDKTEEQKRLEESFKALEPKPDLKPGEKEVPVDSVVTEDEFLKQCPTCKPLSEVGKSDSLLRQAFGEPTDLTNTAKQPSSMLIGEITAPENVSKLNSDLGNNAFVEPNGELSERDRLNAASTFQEGAPLGRLEERPTPERGFGEENKSFNVIKENGAISSISAKEPVSDETWKEMVTDAQKRMANDCPSGMSCLMINDENNQSLKVLYSKVSPGLLPEGAAVLTPNQDKLAASGGFWSTVTGNGPSTQDVAAVLQKEGATVTMPDGRDVRMTFNAQSAAAVAPSIAATYNSDDTSFVDRASSYLGVDKSRVADGSFVKADPTYTPTETVTVVEPEQKPVRVPIYTSDTPSQPTPVEVISSRDAPPAPKLPSETSDTPSEVRPSVRPSVDEAYTPLDKPDTPARPSTETPARPSVETPPRPSTETPARPSTETPARPTGEAPAAPSAPSAPSGPAPSQSAPSPQSSSQQQANILDRLYCLIFTCTPQQQAQPAQQQQPIQQPAPAQQQPTQQNSAVAQNQPSNTQTTPPAQQQAVRENPATPSPTPSSQPDTSQVLPPSQPAANQPSTQPSPSRLNPVRLTSSGANNASAPQWTESAQTPAAPTTRSGNGAAASSNGEQSARAASKPALSPIAISSAAAQLVARATAQTSPSAAAPAQKPVNGLKAPTLAVNKATDPSNAVPRQTTTEKPNPAANNPNAGGTAGSPDGKPELTEVKKVEALIDKGEGGGKNEKVVKIETQNPETKKPTEGPATEQKLGTGGNGAGKGTGIGNGNGSEAGVQGQTCGITCLAQKALQNMAQVFGVSPAQATPTQAVSVKDAQQQVYEKLREVKEQLAESQKMGETLAALEPLRTALKAGKDAAEIANGVSDPNIKALAGDLNKKVVDIQNVLNAWDRSHFADGTAGRAIKQMKSQFPTAIPAAGDALTKLNDELTKLASAPPKTETPMNNPTPVARPAAQPSPNTATAAPTQQVPAAPSPAQQAAAARQALKSAADAYNTPAYRANNWQKLRSETLRSDLVQAVYNVRDQKPITIEQQQALKPYLTGKNEFQNGTVQSKAAAEAEFKNLDRYISHINDDWCAGTVAAVMNKVAEGKVPNYIYVDDFYKSMKESGTLHPKGDGYQPQPMDLFFTPKGGDNGSASPLGAGYAVRDASGVLQPGKSQISGHVGFVASYDPSTQTVTTIEGNASGEYKSLRRPLSQIMAFGDTTSYMEKTAPGSVQKQSQGTPDPKSPVVVPKNAPNIPGAYNPASGAQLINAANTVCKVIGCNAQTAARALGGVVGIESEGNAQVPHPGSPYQGYGQLGEDETNRALAKLKQIAQATNLTPEERSVINDVIRRADVQVASGRNPNTDDHAGPWLLAGLHAEQGTLAKATALTNDPRLAAAYMMNAQFAPSMMKDPSYGPNTVLPPNAVAAYNKQGGLFVPIGATVADAAQQVMRWKSDRIDKGISMIDRLAGGSDYVPFTGGQPVACGYRGCATVPTIEAGKDGRVQGIQRAASCDGAGMCAQSYHTNVAYKTSGLSRDQFVQAAREEEALERLAQNGKLPDGANFRDFKATQSNKDAVNPLTAIAKADGHPVIPGAKVDSWFPMSDISKAPRRDAIISHQSGGPWGSGLNTARAQTYNGVHSLGTEWWVLADGTILHTRPEVDTAHIGVNKPPDAKHLLNDNTVGIEFEGQIGQKLSPQQIESGKKLMQYLQERYNLPASEVYRHGKIGGREGAEMEQITREMNYKPGTGVPAYDVTDKDGVLVAKDVALDPRSVSGAGDVRLLSDKDGKPLGQDGTAIQNGAAPLLASSDATLPKATPDPSDPEKVRFADERPEQPKVAGKGFRSPNERDWTRGDYYASSRPTSYCVDNNGQVYGCTPTGGSNPTGGTAPSGGAPMQSSQVAQQQYPRQYPLQSPYPYPPLPSLPQPVVTPPLTASLSCSPASVPFGTSTPVTVSWSCLTGSASSTGFATNGVAVGRVVQKSSATGSTTIRYFLQCVNGARISPVATCSVPVVTPPAPSVSLSADPNPVAEHASAIVIWGSSNAQSCSIKTDEGAELIDGSTDGATSTPALTSTTRLTLRCVNATGVSASTSIQVRVSGEQNVGS